MSKNNGGGNVIFEDLCYQAFRMYMRTGHTQKIKVSTKRDADQVIKIMRKRYEGVLCEVYYPDKQGHMEVMTV
jgi:hypothetical protein